MVSRLRRLPSCMAFYEHPAVKEKHCVRRPGIGFFFNGRRLVGITEFLKKTYYPIFTATRRGGKGKTIKGNQKRNKGLRMGSVADSAITTYVKTGDLRKMASCPAARRIAAFLHKHDLKIVDAHVLIFEARFNIATEIDVLCHGKSGLIVIENKTTLQTRAEHEQTYRKPDRDRPLLLNGLRSLLNSEYIHHQLQLGSMLIMLKNTYNIKATGYILVASTDGINHYPMNQEILNLLATDLCTRRHFLPPPQTINFTIPTVPYKFRPFVHSSIDLNLTELPPAIKTFIKKNAPDAKIIFYSNTGDITFSERPDIVFPMHVDIYAETDTVIYLFKIKETTLSQKECQITNTENPKLPTGHPNTFWSLHALELSLAARALKTKKKIELRVLYIPSGLKPYLRKVPISFLSKLR